MRIRPALLALAIGIAATAGAQVPTPVAEKITTHLGTTTRISLFSNRIVVVSVRSTTESYIHRTELEPDIYMTYLQTLEEAAGSVGRNPVSSRVESQESMTNLTLHIGPNAPTTYTYSPLASLNLSLGRISSLMEDLREQTMASLPGQIELSRWEPETGECVELRQGGRACVLAVKEDGTVILEREDIVITYTVAPEDRAALILRVIEPGS